MAALARVESIVKTSFGEERNSTGIFEHAVLAGVLEDGACIITAIAHISSRLKPAGDVLIL